MVGNFHCHNVCSCLSYAAIHSQLTLNWLDAQLFLRICSTTCGHPLTTIFSDGRGPSLWDLRLATACNWDPQGSQRTHGRGQVCGVLTDT